MGFGIALTFQFICCLCSHPLSLVTWNNSRLIVLTDPAGQEFGQGTAGMACPCFTVSGAWAWKTQAAGEDSDGWGLGSPWGFFTHLSPELEWLEGWAHLRLLTRAPSHVLSMWCRFLTAWWPGIQRGQCREQVFPQKLLKPHDPFCSVTNKQVAKASPDCSAWGSDSTSCGKQVKEFVAVFKIATTNFLYILKLVISMINPCWLYCFFPKIENKKNPTRSSDK